MKNAAIDERVLHAKVIVFFISSLDKLIERLDFAVHPFT